MWCGWCVSSVIIVLSLTRFIHDGVIMAWWRHQMEIFSALLALCAGNSHVTGEFPSQRPVTRSLDVFFDLRLDKRWSKQSWGWWFKTASSWLWRHCNGEVILWYTSTTAPIHENASRITISWLQNPSLTDGLSSWRACNVDLWCFICCRPEEPSKNIPWFKTSCVKSDVTVMCAYG